MFVEPLNELPCTTVRKILILRTAPTPQVRWAIEQLKDAYPDASFWILGRQLDDSLFESMQKMTLNRPWLNVRSYTPFRRQVAKTGFDLAVMCLNNESLAGYENVSRVMKRVPAPLKLVAAYTREWYEWKHDLFDNGNTVLRWAVAALELVLLPLVFAAVAAMPAGRTYLPEGQDRTPPRYDR